MGRQKRIVVGVTGSIGSGKSSAARYLGRHGFTVLDVDHIYDEISGKGSVIQKRIAEEFGDWAVVKGKLNREALRELVFKDKRMLKKLNTITHPLIIKETLRRLKKVKGNAVLDVALLIETNFHKICDYVVLVHCPTSVVVRRLWKERKMPRSQVLAILKAQMPHSQKKMHADFLVDTSGSYSRTYDQLDRILTTVQKQKG
jgi:dephospho-CoA kinase